MKYIKLFERFENVLFKGDDIKNFRAGEQLFFSTLKFHMKQSPSLQYSGPFSLHSDHFDKECNLTRLEDYEVSAIKYNL